MSNAIQSLRIIQVFYQQWKSILTQLSQEKAHPDAGMHETTLLMKPENFQDFKSKWMKKLEKRQNQPISLES
jgi:hypothetical protein